MSVANQQSFEADVSAYLKALPSQISQNEGKFALVGGGKLIDVFDSEAAAMQAGYQRFGMRGFLVQEITRFDMEMGQHWLQQA
jgi:hypothetical protein